MGVGEGLIGILGINGGLPGNFAISGDILGILEPPFSPTEIDLEAGNLISHENINKNESQNEG